MKLRARAESKTLIVEVKPKVQAELSRQESAYRVDFGSYAAGLLEESAHSTVEPKHLTVDQLESTFQELAQFSHKIPSLPYEVFLAREHVPRPLLEKLIGLSDLDRFN